MNQPSAHALSVSLSGLTSRNPAAAVADTASGGSAFGVVLKESALVADGDASGRPPAAGGNLLPAAGTALPVPPGEQPEVTLLAEFGADAAIAAPSAVPLGAAGGDLDLLSAALGRPAAAAGSASGLPAVSDRSGETPAMAPAAGLSLRQGPRQLLADAFPATAAAEGPGIGSRAAAGAQQTTAAAAMNSDAGSAETRAARLAADPLAGIRGPTMDTLQRSPAAMAANEQRGTDVNGLAGATRLAGTGHDPLALTNSGDAGGLRQQHANAGRRADRSGPGAGIGLAAAGSSRSDATMSRQLRPLAGLRIAGEASGQLPDPTSAGRTVAGASDAAVLRTETPIGPGGTAMQSSPGVSATSAAPAAAATTPAGMPAFNLDPDVLDPAWQSALGERVVWMAGRNVQSAELRLNPAELGPLQVQISVDDGKAVTLTVSAAQPLTREALESAMPRLRDMLAENGMDLAGATVSDQGVGARGEERGDSADGEPDTSAPLTVQDDSLKPAAAVSADDNDRGPHGSIDLFA